MRLAITSKNYESFTRPLPMSAVKEIAQVKNKELLPKIDTVASVTQKAASQNLMMKPQSIPCSLPTSTEAILLVNPNLQVHSEELRQKITDERYKHLRLTRLKMLQSGKAELFDQASEVKSLIEKNKKITPTSNTVKKASKIEED